MGVTVPNEHHVVAVTAVGRDRPGIVAAVTAVLTERGANIEDSTMSILGGHFAMLLIVSLPEGTTAEELEDGLAGVASSLELVVAVRDIDDPGDGGGDGAGGESWVVSVYGADRPGIVSAVTGRLAEQGANVVDLTTRVIGDRERPVYAMVLDVTLPPDVDGDVVAAELAALGRDLGVECRAHRAEADVL